MKVIVDQEGKELITKLCDLALRGAGVAGLNLVNQIAGLLEDYVIPDSEEEK